METGSPSYDVLHYLPDGIVIVDGRGVVLFANNAFSEILGYSQAQLVGLNMLSLLADIDVFRLCIEKVLKEGKSLDDNTDFIHNDGSIIHTAKCVRMIREGESLRFFVTVRNLAEVNLRNKELRHSYEIIEHQAHELSSLLHSKNQELEEILQSIDEVIWYIDNQTLSLHYVNDAVKTIFGFAKEAFLADSLLWQQQIHPDDRTLVRTFFETLMPGLSQEIRFRIHHASGELRWISSRIHHHPKLHLFVGITRDITESKAQSEENTFLAYHDPLTQLPNRTKLKHQIDGRIEKSSDATFALLFLDLDNFKNINDTMGHEIGDRILIDVSRRLGEAMGETHFCARFGGDEFVFLVHNTDAAEIDRFCTRLIELFQDPFPIGDNRFFLSASIGIALYPEDASVGEDLIKYADTAMYTAKNNGKNRFVYYHHSMKQALRNFLHIESLIRDALSDNLFELYFQPLIDSRTLLLEGFEALLRLPHPAEGFIPPDAFIPVAEKNGDILRIGDEVLKQACDFIETTRQLYHAPFFVAVNISAKQLGKERFAQEILEYLHNRAIPASFLKVELTESAVMENAEISTRQLRTLKEGGVRIALDDFGTGYSSFAYLAQLPIDTLKIDKSFILDLFDVESHRHIVEAMSNLAHALGMRVTAEGVEEASHFDFLVDNRIDTLQGYHLGRPLPKKEIFNLIEKQARYFTPTQTSGILSNL